MVKFSLLLLLVFTTLSNAFQGATGYVPNPFRYIGAQFRDYTHSKFMGAAPLPAEFDLRHLGNGTAPVRDQGSCGSCWAFGTKGVVESLVRLRDAKDIEVSGQWMIDCDPAAFAGCGGGDMAFDKFLSPRGAVYESEYPKAYEQANDTCENDWLTGGHFHEQLVDWAFIKNDVDSMQRAMFENEAPLAVTVGAGGMSPGSDGWQDSCRSAGTNHIVYLVGWLEGSLHGHKAGPHWILQNSWNTSFGDEGYEYLLARKGNTICASLGADEVALANYKPACTPQPKADAGPDKKIILMPGLSHSVSIGTQPLDGMTYSWSPSSHLDNASMATPMASPIKTTEYSVTVTSKCGQASSKVLVHVYHKVRK